MGWVRGSLTACWAGKQGVTPNGLRLLDGAPPAPAPPQGDEAKVRQMLQQGCPADSADYDGRTALELATVKGHTGVVDLLLAAGADANLQVGRARASVCLPEGAVLWTASAGACSACASGSRHRRNGSKA